MGVYKAPQRKKYAVVKRPGRPASEQGYPIGDKAHARVALARINQGGLTPAQKARVRAAARRKLGKEKR